jgi:protein gp37
MRKDKPWLNGLPRLIFVSDMSDALSEAVEFSYLKREVIEVVQGELGRRHCWLWLTKRPQRMAEFSKYIQQTWPVNLWVGTSITTQKSTARIKRLLKVGDGNSVRFLSVEPQWESVELSDRVGSRVLARILENVLTIGHLLDTRTAVQRCRVGDVAFAKHLHQALSGL